jgi:hypothetical protein
VRISDALTGTARAAATTPISPRRS